VNARTRKRIAVIKDLGSYALACLLIVQQALLVPYGQRDPLLLLMAGALIGVPGASTALSRYLGGTKPRGSSRR
jgi:hypothetical protein